MTYVVRDRDGGIVAYYPEFDPPRSIALQDGDARRAVGVTLEPEPTYVIDHGRPHVEPWLGSYPAAAERFERVALAAGFEVRVRDMTERGVRVGTVVEGLHRERRVGFRAYWKRGRTAGATWHEPTRWAMVEDRREVRMHATARVGLKGSRSAGMGTTRLARLSSPSGIEIGVAALAVRIKETTR